MNKILIANRGEIALRVIRSIREMGLQSVAIFSDADRNLPYVRWADEAVHIGKSIPSESYLNMQGIIEAALAVGAEGIHPGYGFLSENSIFSKEVKDAGLVFIGPSASAIESMGNKLKAKEIARENNIPMVPGSGEAVSESSVAQKIASDIGFPVMIKAASGGGGKGMRIVNMPNEFDEQLERAMSEAKASFGDESVFIEKYITAPRHIEFQILGDNHGNVIHLNERECTIQRRHQKVIEEAPSVVLSNELRMQMGEAAVRIAKACEYSGAGTAEFLLDKDRNFYFLEMNTRLQVEHPITEMITGIDLVRQQILIAQNEKLQFKQDEIPIKGHAIELRLNAEDVNNDFLPVIGELEEYVVPKGPGIRVDDGFEAGNEISVYYDSMIGKLIVHAENRTLAISKLKRAIEEYRIKGIKTTLDFGKWACTNAKFISGDFTTNFIKEEFKRSSSLRLSEEERMIAAVAFSLFQNPNKKSENGTALAKSNWKKNRKILN